VETFIRNENLKLYRRALAASTDDEQRRVLLALLKVLVIEQATAALEQLDPKSKSPLGNSSSNGGSG
jgi:hypothetical protein